MSYEELVMNQQFIEFHKNLNRTYRMANEIPLVEIKVIEGEVSKNDTKKLIADVTYILVSFCGENLRSNIWIIVQGIKTGKFGVGG
jgi:phenylpyruvate tautomerase PptA (4-oxalocrotonate tautomerase family)